MKKFYLVALAIIGIYACFNLSSCNKDDDVYGNHMVEANATGIKIFAFSKDYYMQNYFLWINEYVVMAVNENDNTYYDASFDSEFSKYFFKYYPINDEIIEEIVKRIGESYGPGEREEFIINTQNSYLEAINSYKLNYQYIAVRGEVDVFLFNRIKAINYGE